jgi:uncharacterized membrane protein YdjX (TVP38/TMEM64 family)
LKAQLTFTSSLTVYLAIAPAAGSSFLGVWLVQNESTVQQFQFFDWLVALLILTILSAVAITPPTLLAFVFGYFLGWVAVLPLISMNLLAIMSVYWAVQLFDKKSIYNFLMAYPRTKSFFEQIQTNQFRFIFFTKLSPVLPFALTNVLFAVADLRLKNILGGGFLGMIPRTVLAVWVGYEAQNIKKLLNNPNENPASRIVIVVLFLISIWGIIWVFKKKNAT